jgi:hypothetical protein
MMKPWLAAQEQNTSVYSTQFGSEDAVVAAGKYLADIHESTAYWSFNTGPISAPSCMVLICKQQF